MKKLDIFFFHKKNHKQINTPSKKYQLLRLLPDSSMAIYCSSSPTGSTMSVHECLWAFVDVHGTAMALLIYGTATAVPEGAFMHEIMKKAATKPPWESVSCTFMKSQTRYTSWN